MKERKIKGKKEGRGKEEIKEQMIRETEKESMKKGKAFPVTEALPAPFAAPRCPRRAAAPGPHSCLGHAWESGQPGWGGAGPPGPPTTVSYI